MSGAITFGTTVYLKNVKSDAIGYLGVCKKLSDTGWDRKFPEVYDVVAHGNNDNDRKLTEVCWTITSANGKKNGDPVAVGDKIHLQSKVDGGGYLDTCSWVELEEALQGPQGAYKGNLKCGVFTSKADNRDHGSGTWTIQRDGKSGEQNLAENDVITLVNGFTAGTSESPTSGSAGSLVIYGDGIQDEAWEGFVGPRFDAFTSTKSSVITDSGRWRIALSAAP